MEVTRFSNCERYHSSLLPLSVRFGICDIFNIRELTVYELPYIKLQPTTAVISLVNVYRPLSACFPAPVSRSLSLVIDCSCCPASVWKRSELSEGSA